MRYVLPRQYKDLKPAEHAHKAVTVWAEFE